MTSLRRSIVTVNTLVPVWSVFVVFPFTGDFAIRVTVRRVASRTEPNIEHGGRTKKEVEMTTSKTNAMTCAFGISLGLVFSSGTAHAQLLPCDQVNSNGNVVGKNVCISKSLREQVGEGHGDRFLPGSSVYLIKRDPARSIRRGRQLFQRKFTQTEGVGPRVSQHSTGDITQTRALGAGLADSCAACHGRPKGSAGHGGDVATRPDSRDAPHLFGLGIVEQLADEMTTELRAIRSAAVREAQSGSTETELLRAGFDNGDLGGFVFVDDPFGTSEPAYSEGFLTSDAPGDNRVAIMLGGLDFIDIFGMSGGWKRELVLTSPAQVTISFQYRLLHAANYESDEFSEVRLSVGGQVVVVNRIDGDGFGGGTQIVEQPAEIVLSLDAGSHELVLGAYSNKKTFDDEVTFVSFDDLSVVTTGGPAGDVTKELVAKGISFGQITARSDGTVDTSRVDGVDANLRVLPFFHQGGTASIREFVIGAMNAEMGLQAWDPVLCAVTDPEAPVAAQSPSGFTYDPALDTFERPPVCDDLADADSDGVSGELDPALIDHLEFYLLNYFKPGQYEVTARSQAGRQQMDAIGCTSCHVADLRIDSDRRVADVETNFDSERGIFNSLFASATLLLQNIDDGQELPLALPAEDAFLVRNFFSDLKRHDLGPAFHERDYDGTVVKEFVTEPLWGVATTAPYGHDGRSINLDAVIRRHGGEAQASRDAYVALDADSRGQILDFLQTLVLFPPDDTASDLNPGNPADLTNIQDPDVHGTINLGALFQTDSGPE